MSVIWNRHVLAEEEFFEINIKFLFYVGLWPSDHWTKHQKILYKAYEFTMHFLALIYLIITGIGAYQNRNEIIVLLDGLDKSFVAYNFLLKAIFFISKRDALRTLIFEIAHSGDIVSEERKKLMATHVIFITALSTGVVSCFSVFSFYKFEMLVGSWMPFDPFKNRMYLALSTQILAFTFVVPCLYRLLAMQGIVCSLMMYLCDQLTEVQAKLRNLQYTAESEVQMREAFKNIVQKHVRLRRYAMAMEELFQEFFLVQHLAVTMELMLNAMMVTMINEKNMLVGFLAFLAAALINAYIYCYLGNEVIILSEGIADAAYDTSWTSWPVYLQKDLLLLIRSAQKPMKLSAGGMAPLSIQTFSQALYNGYSIFAVLNDVVD